ncbi:MAG TPA: hypothetical protein VGZ00_06630 [Candidatus Baltobacteraceae bacterium]|jgi:hypothetical protein|nr:hypothetical protein [Candidatus Baltobacteraceae bacterium]
MILAFEDSSWWTLDAVTKERIDRATLREFLVPIVKQTEGKFYDDEPNGLATQWSNTVAKLTGPDREGYLRIRWHDCGTKPTPVPNECPDLIFLCKGSPETVISLSISAQRPDGVYLTRPEARASLEKMERALVNIAGVVAQRFPSLIFFDRSTAIYSSKEMIELSIERKQREESWGYSLSRARALQLEKDGEIYLAQLDKILTAGCKGDR